MLTNLKRFYRPKSIAEALALLEKNSGSILVIAGGTKLVKTRNSIVQELVDITGLGLDYIRENNGIVRIGATTPLQKMVESQLLKTAYQGIVNEAAQITHRSKMIRNASTMSGELVTTNSLSVLYCAFLVLQAQVRIVGGEEFALAMNIFKNKKELSGGLMVEVLIPALKENTFTAIETLQQKQGLPVIAASARVTLEKGKCTQIKLAITGTRNCPKRLHAIEDTMIGQELNHANIERFSNEINSHYFPVTDTFATEEFRKETSPLVIKKVLNRCLENAENNL